VALRLIARRRVKRGEFPLETILAAFLDPLAVHRVSAIRLSDRVSQREMGAGIAASPHLRRAKDTPVFVSF